MTLSVPHPDPSPTAAGEGRSTRHDCIFPPRLAGRERGLGGEGMQIDGASHPIIVHNLPWKC
ncbi:hypothetical protein Hgul01_00296 [Herpetosiphon gulosus]|uniref:Uncharacterized protein n=1 Tax=Herpetosiphon gulosus TaxID=1973496 RepID=A0ABP9WWA4_9CHLR